MSAPAPARIFRSADVFAFVGALSAVDLHVHRAPALLIAPERPIRVRVPGADWRPFSGARIAAGVVHELDCAGAPLAVVYLDPARHGAWHDGPSLQLADARSGWVGEARRLLAAMEDGALDTGFDATAWTGLAARLQPDAAKPRARHRLDRFLDELHGIEPTSADAPWHLDLVRASALAGLSPHRFSHRFSAAHELSWVAYRNWMRLMASTAETFSSGASLTEIALRHGYSTPSHFAASFRGHFGIRPSELQRLRAPPPTARI